jgi:hypothetical protein
MSFFIYFIACVLMLAAGIWLTAKTNVGYVPPDVPLIVRVFGPVLLLASLIFLGMLFKAKWRELDKD